MTKARSDAVSGGPGAQPPASVSQRATSGPTRTGPRRKLCAAKPPAAGKKPAATKLGHVEATGETPLGDSLELAPDGYTWINLWAGWCGPCREEIPLLKTWEAKLGGKLKVQLLSIDDDERLAQRFLGEQPQGGVKRSYHLRPGDTRAEWLGSVGIHEVSQLPMHVILDRSGAVACVASGAVDAADFAEVETLVSK